MSTSDDLRLSLMRNSIDEYAANKRDLGQLVADLESLYNSLEDCPNAWRGAFREQWGVLEEVYSVAVVREQPVDDETHTSLVEPAIDRIRNLIAEIPKVS